ncbi:hypothetical protein C8J48_2433 [Desmospora activa DSM 45169]|uniref:Uncharacterized protein n=1 Tax=Desmospora activa DSM 45169 TaxID=1121389 RepID=A0A2T4ZD31_9BACL|nr:hypothetical protein C8J48_2433 [Desmospora activa DSM 45169]
MIQPKGQMAFPEVQSSGKADAGVRWVKHG